jgi:hypothetical protein
VTGLLISGSGRLRQLARSCFDAASDMMNSFPARRSERRAFYCDQSWFFARASGENPKLPKDVGGKMRSEAHARRAGGAAMGWLVMCMALMARREAGWALRSVAKYAEIK